MALLVAPPGSPISDMADLKRLTVGVIGGDINKNLVKVLSDEYDLAWDGTTLTKAQGKTGNTLVLADTPSGFFSKISPCAALAPGDRLAPVNAALLAYLDREYDAGFGPVEAAPDLR